MTREEKINLIKMAYDEDLRYDPRICFEEGIEWADNHPKSPWISVEDDLPCNYDELIDHHSDNSITTIVLVCYKGNVYGIDYMFNIPKRELGWEWSKGTPCYWMPIPEPSKE